MSDLDFSVCFSYCWKKADPIEIFFTICLPHGEVVVKIVDYSNYIPPTSVCIFYTNFQECSNEYNELVQLKTMFYMEKMKGSESALKKLRELMDFVSSHCNFNYTIKRLCQDDSCPYLPEMLVGGLNEEK